MRKHLPVAVSDRWLEWGWEPFQSCLHLKEWSSRLSVGLPLGGGIFSDVSLVEKERISSQTFCSSVFVAFLDGRSGSWLVESPRVVTRPASHGRLFGGEAAERTSSCCGLQGHWSSCYRSLWFVIERPYLQQLFPLDVEEILSLLKMYTVTSQARNRTLLNCSCARNWRHMQF